MLKLRRQLKLKGASASLFNFSDNIKFNFPPESRKRTADRLSQEMEEEGSDSTGRASSSKRTRTNSLLQDDELDEDEQALARNLPPVSTSRSSTGPVRRRNVVLSDEDNDLQEGEAEGESAFLCRQAILGNFVDVQVSMTCMISLIYQKRI